MIKNPQPTKHLEVKTYAHKGVSVCVEINYDAGTISILEGTTKEPKKWVFAGRSLEYMAGWQNILDAMKQAIESAEADLDKHQKAREKALEKKHIDLMQAMAEENPLNNLKRGYIGKVEDVVIYKSKKK